MENTTKNTGLYLPQMEKDACGIGFVAHLKGEKSHRIIKDALTMLENMEHRGACGCEENTAMAQVSYCKFHMIIIKRKLQK